MQQFSSQLAARNIDMREIRGVGIRAFMSAECLLDELFQAGKLVWLDDRDEQAAQRRYEAGQWFRRLYTRCKLDGPVTMSYEVAGRDKGELSDTEAERLRWNRDVLTDAHKAVGEKYWRAIRDACCFDKRVPLQDLRDGLDALADHRGM